MEYTIKQDDKTLTYMVPDMATSDFILDELVQSKYVEHVETYWQSKYNDYVIYDFKPFSTEGFYIRREITFTSIVDMLFAKYGIENYLENVTKLEQCFRIDVTSEHTEYKKIKELNEV